MNCAYHSQNVAVVNCNGCAKPLCPACDHRIKGFPYCQDCIVLGVDLLRQQSRANYAPFVKKRTSPFIAALLSFICPGLGAAYNGQTTKALVYFAICVGLFQLALISGMPIFGLGSVGMWFFALLDAWRTAQMIRSGVTPDTAEDILVKRFSGNTKLWGVVLGILGLAFLIRWMGVDLRFLFKPLLPLMLIGLGIYLLRGYIFKRKSTSDYTADVHGRSVSPNFAISTTSYDPRRYDSEETVYADRTRSGAWRDR
jgi:hypothetical protein